MSDIRKSIRLPEIKAWIDISGLMVGREPESACSVQMEAKAYSKMKTRGMKSDSQR